jgi:hypothetical protein
VKDFEEIMKSASKDVGVTSGYRRQLTLSAASSSTIEEEDINRRAIKVPPVPFPVLEAGGRGRISESQVRA